MLHDIRCCLGDVEAADQVNVDRVGKERQIHRRFAAQYPAGADNAGTVDGNIQPTVDFGGLVDRLR